MLEEEDEEEGVAAFTDVGPLVRFPAWRGKTCIEGNLLHICVTYHQNDDGNDRFLRDATGWSRCAAADG